MHEGYHFVWLSGKRPYLITPSGKLVSLAVEDDIPYHISGDPRCQPVEPTHEMSIPCLIEHMRDITGIGPKLATPAESPGDADADEMLEEALRQLESEEYKSKESVLGPPADDEADPSGEAHDAEGGVPDDESGVVLVDENNGAPVKVPKRKLKEEAMSMAHLISHRFKNPYCQACVRGKMRHLYTKTGTFQRELKEWGDAVTMISYFLKISWMTTS